MKILRTAPEICSWSRAEKRAGRRVAFVPTMGALHEGHLSLMVEGKKLAESLVASIYVNPTQFGPNEDLARYPRDLEADLAKCRSVGVDAVFQPTDDVMYPAGSRTFVTVEGVTENLCGASRPGHFRGVTTVVAKLFNMVEPDIALFGEKDFQQLVVLKKMAHDLGMPIEIKGCPIVREPDGLAMSSRNKHLSASERRSALSLYRSLFIAEEMLKSGETSAKKIIARVKDSIESEGNVRIDYAKFVDPESMEDIEWIGRPALLAVAAFVGATRLIDNRLFS